MFGEGVLDESMPRNSTTQPLGGPNVATSTGAVNRDPHRSDGKFRLQLEAVSKTYGAVAVVKPLSLTVENGEFLTILGPSGSGKTTILRMVGGFTQPSSGKICFGGADITNVPTHKRPFNTVFQDYALFPHMTVAQNVGYGLMLRKEPKSKISKTVADTLQIVGLSGLLDRYPSQLSGGQRQRVALARAIVCEPKLILLDEPLAALDAELRQQMQFFLKALQRRIETTFLFVTHDQEEATTMSDRIVVMNAGAIEQVGPPKEIYYQPRTPFVARFFGDNNLIEGKIITGSTVEVPFGQVRTEIPKDLPVGAPVVVAVRPEKLSFGQPTQPRDLVIDADIEDVVFVGAVTHVILRPKASPQHPLTAKITNGVSGEEYTPGRSVKVVIRPSDVAIIPSDVSQ